MKISFTIYSVVCVLFILSGCSSEEGSSDTENTSKVPGRWYSQAQVNRGNPVYQANCAVCHKSDAAGTEDWKTTDANGNYPPPPLNGTAHTWHHSMSVLQRTIRVGGVPLGGVMPAFEDKLSKQQIDDVIAFVQSHWNDEIYTLWLERN